MFVERLKELMSEKNVSSVVMAKELGISTVGMSNIMRERNMPKLTTACKMAEILGVSLSYLVGETEEKPDNATIICPHCGKEIHIKAEK
jgi:transcriptional regulator with XRE-family HTH domain